MSATTTREDGAELKFIGGIGPIIAPVDAKQLIHDGYLTQPELVILNPPSPKSLVTPINKNILRGGTQRGEESINSSHRTKIYERKENRST